MAHDPYANASYRQQKFKKLIESTNRYALVNGKVIDLQANDDGTTTATAATVSTPKGRGRPKAAANGASTPKSTGGRKRKVKSPDAESNDEQNDTPAKKRQKGMKGSAGDRVSSKVKQEDQADENNDVEEEEDGVKSNDADMHEHESSSEVI